jgi:hypothetical protein
MQAGALTDSGPDRGTRLVVGSEHERDIVRRHSEDPPRPTRSNYEQGSPKFGDYRYSVRWTDRFLIAEFHQRRIRRMLAAMPVMVL